MAITVTCDDCSESHRVKDDAVGKRFKCKGCGKSLKVKAPEPDEEFAGLDEEDYGDDESDEDEDEYSSKKPAKRSQPTAGRKPAKGKSGKSSVPLRKTKVPIGVDCVYFGFMLTILLIILSVAVGISLRGDVVKMAPMLVGLGLGVIGAGILTTVGKLLCLTAPPQMSGRGGIFAAVAIDVLTITVTIAKIVSKLPPWVDGAVNLLSVAGFVCFILFLRNLGDFMRERDISEQASGVLKLGIVLVITWVLLLVLTIMAAARALPPIVAGLGILVIALGLLIVGIMGVIRYAKLLSTCRYALANC